MTQLTATPGFTIKGWHVLLGVHRLLRHHHRRERQLRRGGLPDLFRARRSTIPTRPASSTTTPWPSVIARRALGWKATDRRAGRCGRRSGFVDRAGKAIEGLTVSGAAGSARDGEGPEGASVRS